MGAIRRTLTGFFLVLVVMITGALGFWHFEGISLFEALYMSVITITTVGYGDYYPHTPYGQIFTMVLILTGVGVVLYVLTGIIGLVLEGQLREALGITRVKRGVAKMKNHRIICGGGRTGSVIADDFREEGLEFVVIDNNTERVKELRKKEILVVEGDATSEETLKEAGVDRASGLVSTLPDDADNLFLSITAKGLNQNLDIVSRAGSEKAAKMLYKTGVKKVVIIEEIAGRRLARSLTKPAVVDFIDFATKKGEASLESIKVQPGAKIANKKVKDLRFKERLGVSIVAVIRDGRVISSIGPEDEILQGDTVVVIGRKEMVEKLGDMDFF
ncbi:MAG: potassium channel family protein [Candidatus Methanospirareceae archaeon]